jgi:mannan endo-1,4-beta-mannosidase
LATDVYSNQFANRDYRTLLALAKGKPIALGEVGNVPTPKLLRQQSQWTWFMYWHDPSTLHGEQKQVWESYQSRETLTYDQLPWVKNKKPRTHHPILK